MWRRAERPPPQAPLIHPASPRTSGRTGPAPPYPVRAVSGAAPRRKTTAGPGGTAVAGENRPEAAASAFGGSGPRFADDAGNGLGSFRTDGEPFVGFLEVDAVIGAVDQWIVGAKLFDVSSVAALAAVHGNDFLIGTVFGPFAGKSDSYGHDGASFSEPGGGRGAKVGRRSRTCQEEFRVFAEIADFFRKKQDLHLAKADLEGAAQDSF